MNNSNLIKLYVKQQSNLLRSIIILFSKLFIVLPQLKGARVK